MNPGQRIIILLIRGYQAVISPALAVFFGPAGRCRYTPSCSQYAREAVGLHGVMAGSALAARRLCRCHPWGASGPDPVPMPCAHLDLNRRDLEFLTVDGHGRTWTDMDGPGLARTNTEEHGP
jgi:putative membrane protein insertion efficiency factor